ncbi:MAG: filamentous hemagglutinin family protein, partial [Clostridia bacterium]|nr:filamentous hemagglutinin family protein [Clostridia bacterium]
MNTKRFSLLCMLLGLFLIIYGIYISYIIPQCQSGKSPQIQQTATINDISLGMRTVGTNPQGKTVDEIGEPNSSWFQIKLRMVKQNQGVLNIELLRPQEWLHAHNVFPGNIIPMDMPEMGAVGGAEVLSVSSAPPIQSGKGNVVSGKFIHEATNCIDLYIEGHDNPIGCTDNHPFWSEDRQEFIPAGELNQGERVLLYSGETARIAQKLPRPGPETVYNLEIWGEHVYHVGNDGVLVHNACTL